LFLRQSKATFLEVLLPKEVHRALTLRLSSCVSLQDALIETNMLVVSFIRDRVSGMELSIGAYQPSQFKHQFKQEARPCFFKNC
jgi:hypothetical protein